MEVSSDSEFDFSRQLVPCPALPWADELFQGGIIRPLKPHTNQEDVSLTSLKRANDPDPIHAPRNRAPPPVSELSLPHHSSSLLTSMGGLKWRLKDALLYRSTSEGRPLKSYSASPPLLLMGWKSFDFRSSFNGDTSSRRYYHRANQVEDEEEIKKRKKKAFGLLSCISFHSSPSSSPSPSPSPSRHHRKLSCFS